MTNQVRLHGRVREGDKVHIFPGGISRSLGFPGGGGVKEQRGGLHKLWSGEGLTCKTSQGTAHSSALELVIFGGSQKFQINQMMKIMRIQQLLFSETFRSSWVQVSGTSAQLPQLRSIQKTPTSMQSLLADITDI